MDNMEEKLFNPRSEAEIEREMSEKGFSFVGLESLTKFEFSEDARFLAKPFRTKEDVKREYQDRFGDEIELELVDQEGLKEGQQAVLIFAKKKDQKSG